MRIVIDNYLAQESTTNGDIFTFRLPLNEEYYNKNYICSIEHASVIATRNGDSGPTQGIMYITSDMNINTISNNLYCDILTMVSNISYKYNANTDLTTNSYHYSGNGSHSFKIIGLKNNIKFSLLSYMNQSFEELNDRFYVSIILNLQEIKE